MVYLQKLPDQSSLFTKTHQNPCTNRSQEIKQENLNLEAKHKKNKMWQIENEVQKNYKKNLRVHHKV